MALSETAPILATLTEKLADSLATIPAVGTRRLVHGAIALPGKVTAIVGMRRAGKTTFLHQLRHERRERGIPQFHLPYVNFEDERLAGMTAEHLHHLVEEYYRRFPQLRGDQLVTW